MEEKEKFEIIVNGSVLRSLTGDELRDMYSSESAFGKAFLENYFPDVSFVPTLDDYRSIRTYEDACAVLGEKPIDEGALLAAGVDDHVIALMKLETVSKALWGRDFKPVPNAEWDGKTYYYWPWFCYYTKEEVESIKKNRDDYEHVAALFGGVANGGADAGFGYLYANYRPTDAGANVGFRLCQQDGERARYFGAQFAKLWADYLTYGFEIKERIF